MQLFSIFDPYACWGAPMNWFALLLIFPILPVSPWLGRSRPMSAKTSFISKINVEFNAILLNSAPGNTLMCMSLITFLVLTNSMGLIPYVFTPSSHLVFCVSFALPIWVGHMTMASIKSPSMVLSHLVPTGSPMLLAPFMVIIELVSNIIRPLTLSVRLTANMVAGHLLLTLISSVCPSAPVSLTFCVIAPLVSLLVLETAVALIQAYVFSILNSLYLKEVDSAVLSL